MMRIENVHLYLKQSILEENASCRKKCIEFTDFDGYFDKLFTFDRCIPEKESEKRYLIHILKQIPNYADNKKTLISG